MSGSLQNLKYCYVLHLWHVLDITFVMHVRHPDLRHIKQSWSTHLMAKTHTVTGDKSSRTVHHDAHIQSSKGSQALIAKVPLTIRLFRRKCSISLAMTGCGKAGLI